MIQFTERKKAGKAFVLEEVGAILGGERENQQKGDKGLSED